MRGVVTGHSPEGKSVFLSDGTPPRVVTLQHLPSLALIDVWATEGRPALPATGSDPTTGMSSLVPGPGETRFRIVHFPPALEWQYVLEAGNLAAVRQAYLANAPGLAEAHEAEDLSMPTTDTVDDGVVLSGHTWLELDDGTEVHLQPGDCVVQNGTRHAWRNRGTELCVMACVMVGAQRRTR
jgi:hypothetical protein